MLRIEPRASFHVPGKLSTTELNSFSPAPLQPAEAISKQHTNQPMDLFKVTSEAVKNALPDPKFISFLFLPSPKLPLGEAHRLTDTHTT